MEIPAELRSVVKRRLREEYFVWFTTVGTDLTPQPRPVWFIWQEDSFLIYSQPTARKVQHVRLHPRVALHFNADATADEGVLVFVGDARVDAEAPPAHLVRAFMRKYRQGIAGLDMTPGALSESYSVAIRVTPTAVRGG